MKILIIILAILILLTAVNLLLPIPACVRIVNGEMSVKLWNFPYIRKKKKANNKGNNKNIASKEGKKFSFSDLKNRIVTARKLYKETKSQLKFILTRLKTVAKVVYYRGVLTIGFGDPMATGVSVGLVGTFFTEINALFTGVLLPNKESYLSAVPNFNESGFNYVLEIRININVLNALLFIKDVFKYKSENNDSIKQIIGGSKK